ncbi:MAG: alkane 1-monooxygenase [Cryomorphaceae bacterium]
MTGFKFLKYGMVLIIPALFFAGLAYGGWLSFGAVIFAFGFIPLVEVLFKPDIQNLGAAEREMRREDKKYDFMLWIVAPVVYASVVAYLVAVSNQPFERFELVGLTLSLGVVLGGIGINVAHELGHRNNKFEQFLAKALLLPNAYMHFFIEHNRGHHKNVSTPGDPASARYNEALYSFWVRSVVYSYISAWKIENKRLQRLGKSKFSWQNEMLQFQIITALFWISIFALFGAKVTLLFTASAIVGFLMLETVNYIEHYGLQRFKVSDNRYERVRPIHSWNSNHIVGRVMLFELSRHSDHHYQPAKKYQILDHHDQSPQMPTGYPGMMLLALLPPLWFAVMNPKINREERTKSSRADFSVAEIS